MARVWQIVVIRCAHCGGVVDSRGWVASCGGKDYHPACVGLARLVREMAQRQAGRRAGRPISGKGRR
jgi:hypothetical protein